MTRNATADEWERNVFDELERSRHMWGDNRGGGDNAVQTPLDEQENYVPAIRVASEAGYAHTWVDIPRIAQDENDQTEAINGPLNGASIIPPDIPSSSRRLEEWVTAPPGQHRRGPTFEGQVYTCPYDDQGGIMSVSEDDEPEIRDDNDSSVPWATDDIRHFSSRAGVTEARSTMAAYDEPVDVRDDDSTRRSARFCCPFTPDRSGGTDHKFFFATDRHDADTVIVGVHAMFDPNSATLGLSCTPMFGVDRDGKELDGGNWDRESCEKAIFTIDTAFRTLRDDESLYIQLSHSAENLRKGSSLKFAQFCNTMLGRLRKDKFESQGRTCHFLVRAAIHHPSRRTGSGPFTLDSLIQPWPCGTGQRLSPANERLLQSRLIAGIHKRYTPPWIPNVVMGKEDIWKNGRISKATT